MLLSVFRKLDGSSTRAEIHESVNGYDVRMYGPNGESLGQRSFENAPIYQVQAEAENWLSSVGQLNG